MSTDVYDTVDHDPRGSQMALWTQENMRRFSRGATRQIALRRGNELQMWLGCGYPKSGTVWLCKLMGTALGLPVPIDYRLPIMMPAVLHSHWLYDARLPPTVYIRRDGRDAVVSLYFFFTKLLRMNRDPKVRHGLEAMFSKLYGRNFEPDDVRGNLPRFIEHEMTTAPTTHGVTWQQHVRGWWDRPRVGHVTYEALLSDTAAELSRGLTAAGGVSLNPAVVEAAAQRHSFTNESGRDAGAEDRTSFLRKGVPGEWRMHFSKEAGETFDFYAGADLVEFGYASDRTWFSELH